MLKRIFKLFQIARKLSTSGAIDTINEIHSLPTSLNLFFNCISFGSTSNEIDKKKEPGEKLCLALQGMGTTFIKLGQFLATRPDIIGNQLANDLEKLQDKLPAFGFEEAKRILKKEGTTVGLANGVLSADGKIIYRAENLKVGLFKS